MQIEEMTERSCTPARAVGYNRVKDKNKMALAGTRTASEHDLASGPQRRGAVAEAAGEPVPRPPDPLRFTVEVRAARSRVRLGTLSDVIVGEPAAGTGAESRGRRRLLIPRPQRSGQVDAAAGARR